MPPIRLALVITELEVGGAERALVRLATGLDRQRFTPVVYSLAPLPAERGPGVVSGHRSIFPDSARPETTPDLLDEGKDQLVHTLTNASIEIHSLAANRWWHFPSAAGTLARLLQKQQPQVLQSFLFHANVVGALAARQASVPHVLLGIRVADPSWWRGRIERAAASRAGCVVCVSQAVADFCRQRHKFPANKLVVIPNGIDVDQASCTVPIDPASLGIPSSRKLLVFIGRLAPQKDPGWLADVAQAALPQLPDHDLVIVGDQRWRNDIAVTAKRLSLEGRIHAAGWRSDALSILAASQILLLTSQYEGMPNVVLEAMALAKPVMASRVEGVVELLGPAAAEQTAPWRDTNAFVRQLVALARDPARCEQLGRANQARAREHFSVPRMIEAYARLYEGLAGSLDGADSSP